MVRVNSNPERRLLPERSGRFRWIAGLLLLFGICLPLLWIEGALWMGSSKQAAGSALSFFAGLAFLWRALGRGNGREERSPPAYLSVLLILSLAGLVLSSITDLRIGVGLATLLAVTLCLRALHGPGSLPRFYLPLAFFLLSLPVPGGVLSAATKILLDGAAWASEVVLGLTLSSVERTGYTFIFANGEAVSIVEDCSGLGGILLLPPLALLFASWPRPLSPVRFGVLFLLSIPAALFANLLRILVTSWLIAGGMKIGADSWFHEGVGIAGLALSIGALFWIGPRGRGGGDREVPDLPGRTGGRDEVGGEVRFPAPAASGWPKSVLAILLVGNLLLHGDRLLFARPATGFDLAGFEASVRKIWPREDWVVGRFPESPLLPRSYLFLYRENRDEPYVSIYAGYYPMDGLLEERPHPPEICYQVQGWKVLEERRPLVLGGGESPTRIQKLTLAYESTDRDVLFWAQGPEGIEAEEGSLEAWFDLLRRHYERGRTDRVWIRIEAAPGLVQTPLTEEWRSRIERLIRAASAAFR